MKLRRKLLITIVPIIVFLGFFYFLWLSPKYVVPILMYHHFGYDDNSLYVTPGNFAKQMEYIKSNGYNVISLDELVEGIKNKRKFEQKTLVITIDDGYEDNYIYAYPILKKYGYPATIFIITNYIGRKNEHLTWVQIRSMLKDNIFFEGHTKNHIYLPEIEKEEILWDETAGCKKMIEDKLKTSVNYFCYPIGGFTEEIKTILKKAGYKGACTTNRGFVDLNMDIYELKRIKVTNSDTNKPFHFWAKLSGYYNLFRSKRPGC